MREPNQMRASWNRTLKTVALAALKRIQATPKYICLIVPPLKINRSRLDPFNGSPESGYANWVGRSGYANWVGRSVGLRPEIIYTKDSFR